MWLGTDAEGARVELDSRHLLRHLVCLGASGSGKTVAAKVVCEALALDGVPVIAVDPQGDIASLALAGDPADLLKHGVPPELAERFAAEVEVVVWTPASSAAVPLSVNPLDSLRADGDREQRVRALAATAGNVASVLDYDLSADDGRCAAAALHLVLEHIVDEGLRVRSMSGLAGLLSELPPGLAERVGELLSDRQLASLRRKVHLLTVGAQQLLFENGVPLDVATLLGKDATATEGKTRISVIYLNTLSRQEEKAFLVGQLAQALYDWMLDNPSAELQAALYIDEVAPFLPPVKKPACKDALTLLFKQARKYGLACVLASQNPGDIDYRCLAQFSTWNLGRMLVRQDLKKVQQTVSAIAGADTEDVMGRLPALGAGRFVMLNPDAFDGPVDLQVRWLLTRHSTLDEEQLDELVPAKLAARLRGVARKRPAPEPPAPTTAAAPASTPASKPAPEPLSEEELLVIKLRNQRRAMTVKQLQPLVDLNENRLRRTLAALVEGGQLTQGKAGRSNVYWHSGYTFYPEHDLLEPVLVAKLAVFEVDARRAARSETSTAFGLFNKELGKATLHHLPLWRVAMTVSETRGVLFWKEQVTRGEYLYVHATRGDILLVDGKGVRFEADVEQAPAEITDLDDVAHFEQVTPDELAVLDEKLLATTLTARDVQKLIERKFPIQAEGLTRLFLPYWRIEVKGSDPLLLDGVLGKPLELR